MSITAEQFRYVGDLVRAEAAIVLHEGKEYLVESRLLPLARAAGAADVADYITRLRACPTPQARADVVDALTTNETFWFRDQEPFDVLTRVVVPDLLARTPPGRPLRIWSAACSSGQEAYSIAMLMAEHVLPTGREVEILATDISESMLTRVREGRYSALEVGRGLPAPMLAQHFTRAGTRWQVSDRLRAMVSVAPLNLAQPLPATPPFDVVFLRNVLIYFDTETKQRILRQVRRVTAPGGSLFLGAAETTLGVDEAWERTTVGRFVLNRAPGGPPLPGTAAPVTASPRPARPPLPTAAPLLTLTTNG